MRSLGEGQTIDFSAVRSEFAVLSRCAYLNTATYGLLPRRALTAMSAHWAHRDERACADFLSWYEEADRIRASIARLIGGQPDDIAFVSNTATALGTLVAGLDWRPGDNVVTLVGEFPTCLYLPALLERRGVTTRQVTFEALTTAEGILAAIDDQTRLVALSEVNFATGCRPPLAELSHQLRARGILLFVDGTQSVGALRFDVPRIQPDMLAVHGYKWLLSPTGAGFMYVAPSLRTRLSPSVVGWRSHVDWREVDDLHRGKPVFTPGAARYEGGGLAFGLLHAMGSVVEWMLDLGPDAIEERVLALSESVRERLVGLGAQPAVRPGSASPIVAVRFPGRSSSELAVALEARGVLVAARDGSLRISPHFYNDASDVERLDAALRQLL